MAMIPHYLHIYDKPAIGSAFKGKYLTRNYKHKKTILGGDDTASCELVVNRATAEQIYEQYIGNRVAVFVDNPNEPIWEGLITRIMLNVGGLVFTMSIDEMFNKISVSRNENNAGTRQTVVNSPTQNTASQAIYGVKETQVQGRYSSATNQTLSIDLLRNRLLNEIAYPQTSAALQSGSWLVKLEMSGFYHTLDWEIDATSFSTNTDQVRIPEFFSRMANGTTFFDNTDFTEFTYNLSRIEGEQRRGETMWNLLLALCEQGDGVDLWTMGVTRTRNNTRRFFYRATNKTLKYTARIQDGLRIRNQYGGLVDAWRVTPDGIIRIVDVLIGWSNTTTDPRETYIKTIDYDAEKNSVTWQGTDNLTVDGVFNFIEYQKQYSSRFGQQPFRLVL